MANSLMQIVSDGSLSTIPLTIQFFEQSHIKVFVNNVELPNETYTFAWSGATTLTITPAVALGMEVSIRRKTPANEVLHDFQAGAVFSEVSVDENFRQELFLLQEASEQSFVTDLYTDLDMHGNKVRNLGAAILPGDAISLAQAQFLADGGEASTLRAELAAAGGAGLVGSLPVFVTSTEYAGGATTSSANNDTAIIAAINDAIATGAYVYWPAVYEVQGNIPNFHSVRHDGPGGIKRGSSTYRVHPLEWTSNTLYAGAAGATGNDGLDVAFPMPKMQKVFDALKSAGPLLNGTWNVSVGAGVMAEKAVITAIRSINAINISGPVVAGQPTAEIDVTGQGAAYAMWFGNDMRFKMSHIMLRGARDGSNLASGLVMDAGVTGHLVNVWTRDCEQNAVNANIRCRLLVEGGDYQADASGIRVYGNSTAFIGWNGVRVKIRDASRGAYTTGSSYSHADYIDFINTAYGIISEYESHSTNYNNTFDGVSVGWEVRDNSTINTANPAFVSPPLIAKSRALRGNIGSNTDLVDENRDTRNLQFYPYLGTSGRTAQGYSAITVPSKTWQWSGDGLASIADWSVAGGVNFVFDWGTIGSANYLGIGAHSSSFSGVAFGDEVGPTRAVLRHQAGGLYIQLSGVSKYRFLASSFGPFSDNDVTCGTATARVKEYYGVSGAINTSDARHKTRPFEITEAMLDAADDIEINVWQWLDAIREKGEDAARWHFGPIAQQIRDAFASHGLNGCDYGLLCYDEWEDQLEDVTEDVIQDDGAVISMTTGEKAVVVPAGNRWGVRPDQCLWLVMAAMRRRDARRDAQLIALERRISMLEGTV